MNANRNDSIDAVKGLCLLHMLFLHLSIIYGIINFSGDGAGIYFHLMEFFMIPFFLFSGYFFSQKLELKDFLKHKAEKLIIPLAFWSIISLPVFYFYQYLSLGYIHWFEPFKMFISIGSLSSNDALWFLFSLFFVNVLFYYVASKLKNEKLLFGFISLCFVYATLDRYFLPCYLSSSNISMGLVYFYIGYKVGIWSKTKEILNWYLFTIALAIFVLISIFDPQWMQIVTLYQSEGLFTLNLFYALVGTYILWFLLSKFSKTQILSYFGRNSMTYYVWHMIPLRLIYDPIVKTYCPEMTYWQYVLVGGGIIIVTSWLIDKLLSRYCPILLGK